MKNTATKKGKKKSTLHAKYDKTSSSYKNSINNFFDSAPKAIEARTS